MSEYMIYFELIKAGISIVIDKVGPRIIDRINTPLNKARNAAVERMADELGRGEYGFPSVNYLEWNFRFDSPTSKSEIQKMLSGETIDEDALKQEMAKEISETRPDLKDKAGLIVDKFLDYFEQECLKSEELKGIALATIIRAENTATQSLVMRNIAGVQNLTAEVADIKRMLSATLPTTRATIDESDIIEVTSELEKMLIAQRDDLRALIKKWQSHGLFEKVQELAERAFKVKGHINKEISGSIFRLFGSYILRSTEDYTLAKKWIDLAHKFDQHNHKTIALRAELYLVKKDWVEAKLLLSPIADSSSEALVKIFYAEALSQSAGSSDAFLWLRQHSDLDKDEFDVKLNLAIFASRCGEYVYATEILDDLKKEAYPGPYPFLINAEILIQKTIPKDLITIATPEDLELIKNRESIIKAIDDFEYGLKLLKMTVKSRSQKEFSYFANKLSAMYLDIRDTIRAEQTLREHWKLIRKESQTWFTAAAIAQQKNAGNNKIIARAQKVLKYSGEEHVEAICAFALLCINIEEWDKCLTTLSRLDSSLLDTDHLKAKLQMTLICLLNIGDHGKAEETISSLKEHFPKDEMWLIHKSIMLARQGDEETAIKLLETEQANFHDSINVKLRLAALYNKIEKFELSLPIYKELTGILGSASSYEMVCLVAFKLQKPAEVLSITNTADLNNVTSENLKHCKAIALTMLRSTDDAIQLFSSFAAETLSANDYLFYASCLANKSDLAKALKLLETAKAKYPKDPRIRRSLYVAYLEINQPEKAFEEACFLLYNEPDERASYFAVMTTGFAIGKDEIAHKSMMDYLQRFGEGPEFKRVSIDEIKEIQRSDVEDRETLWAEYLKGTIPEIFLAHSFRFGVGGHRIMLLESSQQVMAFNGHPDSQKDQFISASEGRNILLDYQAAISLYLLNMMDPAIELFGQLFIPEVVMTQLSADLIKLATSYQKDRREIVRRAFSAIQGSFEIHEKFPKININMADESIGHLTYDLTTAKEATCSFVVPGFEHKDVLAIKTSFDVEIFTVLDLVNIMGSQGLIATKQYEDAIAILSKYQITRHNSSTSIPARLMLDWQSIEMLEECGLLAYLPAAGVKVHIGPFSYALVRSEVDNYLLQEKIHNTLIGLERLVSELVASGKIKIIAVSRKKSNRNLRGIIKKIKEAEYIEEVVNVCSENNFVLWSDDLFIANYFNGVEKIKAISTRIVLDVLVGNNIISMESFIEKIIQLLKWNMFFTWVNVDIILKSAEMYNYTKNEALTIFVKNLTSEISKIPDRSPDSIEKTNFNVASIVIIRLLLISSDKTQRLAMSIFDDIHDATKLKTKLNNYWVSKCIIQIAKTDEIALRDFMQKLSLRFAGQIKDEFKAILRVILKISLTDQPNGIIQIGKRTIVAANILNAIRHSVPGYYQELKAFALKLDSTIDAFL